MQLFCEHVATDGPLGARGPRVGDPCALRALDASEGRGAALMTAAFPASPLGLAKGSQHMSAWVELVCREREGLLHYF